MVSYDKGKKCAVLQDAALVKMLHLKSEMISLMRDNKVVKV